MPNATLQFLNYISGQWDQSIPLRTLWTLQFENLPRVMAGVDFILGNTERTNSSVNKFPINSRISNTIYGNSTIPTLLAQKIEFPNDTVRVAYTSNKNMGGLIGGYYASDREPYNQISIDFLETNKDIIDFVIRPWVLAVSHKGLIEDGETFIKTDIVAEMYTKFSETNWALRKRIIFEGAAPVVATGDTLNYESTNNSKLIRSCTFTYKRYYVTDGSVANNVSTTDISGVLAAEENSDAGVNIRRTNINTPRPNNAIVPTQPISNSTVSQPVNAIGAPTNQPLSPAQLNLNSIQNLVNGTSLPTTPPKLSLKEQQQKAIDNLTIKNFLKGLQ